MVGAGKARATSIPAAVWKERATQPAPTRTAARRVAPNLVCGLVARRSKITLDMLPPRASPQTKLGATNIVVFIPETTKVWPVAGSLSLGPELRRRPAKHAK